MRPVQKPPRRSTASAPRSTVGGLPDGERFFGWEVADAAALDALAARLEKGGVAVRRESAAVADQRRAMWTHHAYP
jgi:hypothetical protein